MTEDRWPTEWLRGVLEVCVLRIVADGPTYGYAVTQALRGGGVGTVKGGTLYPLLSRFEAAGLVAVEWRAGDGGPGRKFYTLTASGRAELVRLSGDWVRFTDVTNRLVQGHTASVEPMRRARG